jgi:hypothetical protein
MMVVPSDTTVPHACIEKTGLFHITLAQAKTKWPCKSFGNNRLLFTCHGHYIATQKMQRMEKG